VGEVMIELDQTISAADVEHVRSDLVGAEFDVTRLRAALAAQTDLAADFTPLAGARAELVETHRRLLAFQTIVAMIAKIDATIPPLQERVNIRRYL
jgi:hemolysin D